MAHRPVYSPDPARPPWVQVKLCEFHWHPGMSLAQKQRSVAALHESAAKEGLGPVLEISTKSKQALGFSLSAFRLLLRSPNGQAYPVEAHYQCAKRFAGGQALPESWISEDPRTIKREMRNFEELPLTGFISSTGEAWPLAAGSAFYDWLYLQALEENPQLRQKLCDYGAYTDIEFNPARQFSCQARSAAISVALDRAGLRTTALKDRRSFLETLHCPELDEIDRPFYWL